MKIIALDLGKKRIGLAISDDLGMARIVREKSVDRILIGNPLHMSGDAGLQSDAARHFAELVTRYVGKEVQLWDERLTTVEASRVLRDSGISIQKRARAVDQLSAVILLQSYLDFLGGSC